jgi:hypothetical protein
MSPQIERLIQLLFATPANFVTRRDRLTYYRIEPEMRWISASALDRWAGTQIGRADVVELVARLIWATAPALYSFRFPSGDAGQLPGFDGHLITPDDFVHPFVPAGESVWEFGTGKDYLNKAQSDYKNRTNDPGPVVPSATRLSLLRRAFGTKRSLAPSIGRNKNWPKANGRRSSPSMP